MTSSEQGNSIDSIAINPILVRNSEYDIAVAGDDIALSKHVRKLVITPTHTGNTVEFRRGNDTLLAIPLKDIVDLCVISNPKSSDKDPDIKIIFNKNQQNNKSVIFNQQDNKSIAFKVKNSKYVHVIKEQINLLRDAEIDSTIQKKIKSILNPELCSICVNDKYIVEFRSSGKLCSSCFEEQYSKIVLDANAVEYHGGDNSHNLGGILAKHDSGNMYLTENYLIFAKEDKEISKKWEIVIPLRSVVLNWELERKQRQMLMEWQGTDVNNFGFGSSFIEKPGKSNIIAILYVDDNGISQRPRFIVSPIRKWIAAIYKMVIKSKVNLTQQVTLQDVASQSTANCFGCSKQFEIYNMDIFEHCIMPLCAMCMRNHTTEPKAIFDSKYLGGHKLHPKSSDTKVFVFSDRIEVGWPRLRVTYNSISNIENGDEKKVSALRVVGLGLLFLPLAIVGALWKKKHIYTIIEYTDALNEEQTIVFDFGGKVEEAQQKMYVAMLAIKQQFPPPELKEIDPVSTISKSTKMNHTDDNPLHILQIRFAKGEISKEEYEEMRKIIES